MRLGADLVLIEVPGMARPQGSKRPMKLGDGRVILREMSSRLPEWRARVAEFAAKAAEGEFWEAHVPVALDLTFSFVRPKSHYGKRKGEPTLRQDAPAVPVGANVGDIDKLSRAVLDALSGVLYHDDRQVASLTVAKRYGEQATLTIKASRLIEP